MDIIIDLKKQTLYLFKFGMLQKEFLISSSKYGIGNLENSFKTPLGIHLISEKIGNGIPLYGIIKNKIYTNKLATGEEKEDLITTRILRLKGMSINENLGGEIDSERRGIWIHGTPNEKQIGSEASHGCIRMRNADIIELYNLVKVNDIVNIMSDKGSVLLRNKKLRRIFNRRKTNLLPERGRRRNERRISERRFPYTIIDSTIKR